MMDYDEDELWIDYGEGYEEELNPFIVVESVLDEVLDENLLNNKLVSTRDLDDYFGV